MAEHDGTRIASCFKPRFSCWVLGVGMVWESKVDVATWFGAGPVYALAINIMPYTPITEWYLRKDWVREAFPILEKVRTSPPHNCYSPLFFENFQIGCEHWWSKGAGARRLFPASLLAVNCFNKKIV